MRRHLEQDRMIAYVEDIVLISKRREILNKVLEEQTSEGSKIRLNSGEDKTKI